MFPTSTGAVAKKNRHCSILVSFDSKTGKSAKITQVRSHLYLDDLTYSNGGLYAAAEDSLDDFIVKINPLSGKIEQKYRVKSNTGEFQFGGIAFNNAGKLFAYNNGFGLFNVDLKNKRETGVFGINDLTVNKNGNSFTSLTSGHSKLFALGVSYDYDDYDIPIEENIYTIDYSKSKVKIVNVDGIGLDGSLTYDKGKLYSILASNLLVEVNSRTGGITPVKLFNNLPDGVSKIETFTAVPGSFIGSPSTPAPVPLPAGLPLLSAGLLAIGALGWSGRRATKRSLA